MLVDPISTLVKELDNPLSMTLGDRSDRAQSSPELRDISRGDEGQSSAYRAIECDSILFEISTLDSSVKSSKTEESSF